MEEGAGRGLSHGGKRIRGGAPDRAGSAAGGSAKQQLFLHDPQRFIPTRRVQLEERIARLNHQQEELLELEEEKDQPTLSSTSKSPTQHSTCHHSQLKHRPSCSMQSIE